MLLISRSYNLIYSDRGSCALLVTDESPEQTLRREMQEELRFVPNQVRYLTEVAITYPSVPPRLHSVVFFVIPINATDLKHMTLREGRAMRLFTPEEAEVLTRVDPL